MKNLTARVIPADLWQAMVALIAGAGLALLLVSSSVFFVLVVGFGIAYLVLFLVRPDLGLLSVLAVRSSTDLSFYVLGGALVSREVGALPNVALILLLVAVGALFIFSRGVPVLSLPGGVLFALLLLTGLIGTLRTESIMVSFGEWLPVVSGLIAYALAAYLFRTPRKVQAVVSVLALSFVVPAAFGLYQLAFGRGLIDPFVGSRVYGSFVHPNAFGVYLVLIFAVFLCQMLVQSGRRRLAALAIVAVAGGLLAGTLTRVAWVGALVVLVVVGMLRSRPLLLVLPVLLAAVLVAVPSIPERLADPLGGSFADRLELWGGLLRQWSLVTGSDGGPVAVALNRLAGLGPGVVGALTAPERWGIPFAAHNDYLRVFVEYGVFGLGLFVALHALLIVFAIRTWRRSEGVMAGVALSFLALAIAYPVMSLTENVFAATQNQIYFWSLAGVAVAIRRQSSEPNPPALQS